MALKSTIIKAQLSLSDMDKHLYQDFNLTLAQHPSENEQRLMVRLLAYALNAREGLEFTKGLCADDEPELWHKNYSGEIELWIELGLPDEKRVKKACNKSKQVVLYTYGENNQTIWWQKQQAKLSGFKNLTIFSLDFATTQALAALADRSMSLTVTVQDGDIWLTSESANIEIKPTQLM
ncbi:YaeQ family protein [Pseudoalteromonas mariniglutinosa]|uniref:YaeQ family protein n=1 Tax=Pseudoalteromonas mariniglutinosa TaxID=206042 RepID=UPI00384E942C